MLNGDKVTDFIAGATSLALRPVGLMPKDKPGTPSERFWQGQWVTTCGHIVTGYVDEYIGQELLLMKPVRSSV